MTCAAGGRSREDLLRALRMNYRWLCESGRAFDDGFEDEAYRLAVSIFTLVYDTPPGRGGASVSVLAQLGIKDDLRYIDTTASNRRNVPLGADWIGSSLTYVALGGDEVSWEPRLDTDEGDHDLVVFGVWWGSHVMRHRNGERWTRRDLTWHLRNKEGGGHLDPRLNEKYAALSDHRAVAIVRFAGNVGEVEFSNTPVLAAVRQVAWELEHTLAAVLDNFS